MAWVLATLGKSTLARGWYQCEKLHSPSSALSIVGQIFSSHLSLKLRSVFTQPRTGISFRQYESQLSLEKELILHSERQALPHRPCYWSPGLATVDRLGREEHCITHKPTLTPPTPGNLHTLPSSRVPGYSVAAEV